MIYNIEELGKAHNAGQKFKYVFFWGHTPPAGGGVNQSCFSQWWKSDFIVDGVRYSCMEQYMMAEKARLFGDEEMEAVIMEAKHPKAMKAYGRAVKNFDKDVWEKNGYEIVRRGNHAKFSQNPQLWDFLRATRNRIIVEASPYDRIWGIGMKSGPEAENPLKWRGRNLLGFALTEVRDQLLIQEGE